MSEASAERCNLRRGYERLQIVTKVTREPLPKAASGPHTRSSSLNILVVLALLERVAENGDLQVPLLILLDAPSRHPRAGLLQRSARARFSSRFEKGTTTTIHKQDGGGGMTKTPL